MRKSVIYAIILLTSVWIVLSENLEPQTIGIGVVISTACMLFSTRFLPGNAVSGIKYIYLLKYFFYVVSRIFLSSFTMIAHIIKGASAEVVIHDLTLSNNFLKVVLANSITLTPGSVTLSLSEDKITVLWLRGNNDTYEASSKAMMSDIHKLETILLSSQKS